MPHIFSSRGEVIDSDRPPTKELLNCVFNSYCRVMTELSVRVKEAVSEDDYIKNIKPHYNLQVWKVDTTPLVKEVEYITSEGYIKIDCNTRHFIVKPSCHDYYISPTIIIPQNKPEPKHHIKLFITSTKYGINRAIVFLNKEEIEIVIQLQNIILENF